MPQNEFHPEHFLRIEINLHSNQTIHTHTHSMNYIHTQYNSNSIATNQMNPRYKVEFLSFIKCK